jgi:succinate-acetate transporter protein
MTDVGQQTAPSTTPAIADPAPLGLAAFAVATFLFSVKNAGWAHGTDGWLGFALGYGGLVQLLAGMWAIRNRDVFGATALSSYGGFYIGLGLYSLLVARGATVAQVSNDLGWILLAFAIFNTYMLLWSTQVNEAVFSVFLALEVTEIILFIGFFTQSTGLVQVGGYIGVITAICAWYASAAGLINAMAGQRTLAVGGPLMKMPAMRHTRTPTPMAH